jgi:uncharacterized phage infection (PIP) family protein YhgE
VSVECNKLEAQVAELQQTCEQYKHMVQQLQSRVAELQQTCQAQIKNTRRFSLLNSVAARMVQVQQYMRQLHHNINELQSGWHQSVMASASWRPPPGREAAKHGELRGEELHPGWVRRASMLRLPRGQHAMGHYDGESGRSTTWENMWLQEVYARHQRCMSELAKVYAACNDCSALLRAKRDLRQPAAC